MFWIMRLRSSQRCDDQHRPLAWPAPTFSVRPISGQLTGSGGSDMQAQQTLIYPFRPLSLGIALVATLVAAAFGLALVVGVHPAVVSQGESTLAQHQQAPDAVE